MISIKKGDRRPAITSTFEAPAGTPVDLTGASVTFRMVPQGSATAKVNASASVVDAKGGRVRYDWQTVDTDTTGVFDAEWVVTYGDGTQQTFPPTGFLTVTISDRA